jgi:hypothetical protein
VLIPCLITKQKQRKAQAGATPVAGKTPDQTARKLREEETRRYEAGIVADLSNALLERLNVFSAQN